MVAERCDGYLDCSDGSDERNCTGKLPPAALSPAHPISQLFSIVTTTSGGPGGQGDVGGCVLQPALGKEPQSIAVSAQPRDAPWSYSPARGLEHQSGFSSLIKY